MRTSLAEEARVHTATGEALVEWKSMHMQLSFVCIGWSGFGGGVRRTCFLAWSHHMCGMLMVQSWENAEVAELQPIQGAAGGGG